MKQSHFLASVLLFGCMNVPGLAWAQSTPAGMMPTPAKPVPAAKVTDPAAAVPPVVYQSVFAGTPTGVEMESADWKKANAEVGQFKRGHVDILKWEESQIQTPMQPKPMATDATKPAAMAPAAPSAPAAPQLLRSSPAPQAPSVHKH